MQVLQDAIFVFGFWSEVVIVYNQVWEIHIWTLLQLLHEA